MAGRVRMLVHPGCGQPSKVSKTVTPKVTTPWIVTTLRLSCQNSRLVTLQSTS
jgi:hypothetical protein